MEIGGYFGLEKFMGSEYYPKLFALNTGRNALACLIHAKCIKKLYIPSTCVMRCSKCAEGRDAHMNSMRLEKISDLGLKGTWMMGSGYI